MQKKRFEGIGKKKRVKLQESSASAREDSDTGGEGGCEVSRYALFACGSSSVSASVRARLCSALADSTFMCGRLDWLSWRCDCLASFFLTTAFFHCATTRTTEATRSKCDMGGADSISTHSIFLRPISALLAKDLERALVINSICCWFRIGSRRPKRRVR